MICRSKEHNSLQNKKKQYTLGLDYYLNDLSIWIKDSDLGFIQIATTNLVEWGG